MSDKDQAIVDACTQAWGESWLAKLANSDNCSGFLKSVASHLGITGIPDGQADDLLNYFKSFWFPLDSGTKARTKVCEGYFVVAGLKSREHQQRVKDGQLAYPSNGHIVVVVDGDPYHGKYPKCWCGSIGAAQSKGDLSVGEVWRQADRDNIHYYIYPTKVSDIGK